MARVSRKNKNVPQKNNQTQTVEKIYQVGIYIRLSNEEQILGGGHKLDNQEQVIKDFIKEKPEFLVSKVYCDNGCTGTNFDRNAFEEMMNDVKNQKINCIIVKDLSRLGRNHIEVEQYLQVIFPFLQVRFIAVNDNFDTLETSADITVSLKNIVNAAYAKDISKKVYSSKQALREKGLFTGNIPSYGYERSKENPHKLVINIETSKVVEEIFVLKLQRKSYSEIARIMNDREILSPMAYWYRRGMVHHEKYANGKWIAPTVKSMLLNQMYVGDMVQGKKVKCLADGITKSKTVSSDEYIVVKGTHEAIIDQEVFEKVQAICDEELERNREKRRRNEGLIVPESVLDSLIFSDDGQKMYRTRNVYDAQRVTFGYIAARHRNINNKGYRSYYISESNIFKIY